MRVGVNLPVAFYWSPLLEPGAIDVVEYRWCFHHATGIHDFLNHRDDFFPHERDRCSRVRPAVVVNGDISPDSPTYINEADRPESTGVVIDIFIH